MRQFDEIVDVRQGGSVVALHLRGGRLDDKAPVGGVGVGAVAQTAVSCGERQGRIGEYIAGIGAGQPRPSTGSMPARRNTATCA